MTEEVRGAPLRHRSTGCPRGGAVDRYWCGGSHSSEAGRSYQHADDHCAVDPTHPCADPPNADDPTHPCADPPNADDPTRQSAGDPNHRYADPPNADDPTRQSAGDPNLCADPQSADDPTHPCADPPNADDRYADDRYADDPNHPYADPQSADDPNLCADPPNADDPNLCADPPNADDRYADDPTLHARPRHEARALGDRRRRAADGGWSVSRPLHRACDGRGGRADHSRGAARDHWADACESA